MEINCSYNEDQCKQYLAGTQFFPVQDADRAAAGIHLAVIKDLFFLSNLIGASASIMYPV